MGEVYRARDTRLDRIVAVKVLASHLSSSPELRQRMEREARAISSLNHPHICQLYDIGSQDGTDYMVMEFLEGETLAERLRKGAMPLAEVFKVSISVAGGAGVRAPQWYCAPRPEAGEHHADAGWSEADGLWPGETAGRAGVGGVWIGTVVYRGGHIERAKSFESADHGGQHRRHHSVHGSRAD
jgi:hypothetical protein